MKRILFLMLAVIFAVAGCSMNFVRNETSYTQRVEGTSTGRQVVDTSGTKNSTDTTQDASGSAATEGAMAAVGAITDAASKLVTDQRQTDSNNPVTTNTNTTTTNQAAQGKVEEELAKPEPQPDPKPGQGEFEEIQ